MEEKKKLVQMGKCNKVHGIKGAFTFYLYNTRDSVLKKGSFVYLFPGSSKSSIAITGHKFEIEQIAFGNKVVATLKGICDRNVAERMLPFEIRFPREEFPKVSENEFYLADLIGLEVRDYKNKRKAGQVEGYYENGGQIVLVVKKDSGEKEDIVYIPQFCPVLDLDNGFIEINFPEHVE